MNKLLIKYITIEDLCSGLFQTQVIDLLTSINKKDSNINFEILIINRFWKIKQHLPQIVKLKKIFKQKSIGVKITYLPFLPPLRKAECNYYYSKFVTIWLTIIIYFTKFKKFDIIHCRSYWPTFAALKIFNCPIIFDLRSLWVLENLSSGNIKSNSKAYDYWNIAEKSALEKSDYSVVVSSGMVNYINSRINIPKVELIPISVDMNKFKFFQNKRNELRNFYKLNNKIVIAYSGSLGMSMINILSLKKMFNFLLDLNNSIHFLILTSEKVKTFESLIFDDVKNDRYTILQPKLENIPSLLSICDFGSHALPYQLDSDTRLGTKVVEYWSCGLPVIVNKNVGAACNYIMDNNFLGIIYDENINNKNLFFKKIVDLNGNCRSLIINFSKNNFSTDIISNKYIDMYYNQLNNNK